MQGAVREVLEEIGIDVSAHLKEHIVADSAFSFVGKLHADRWKQHAAYPDESKRPATVVHKVVRRFLAILPEPIQLTPENSPSAVAVDGRSCGRVEWMTIAQARSVLHPIILAEFEPFMDRADVKAELQAASDRVNAKRQKTAQVTSPAIVDNQKDTPVTADTARYPQYIRAGFRPMLHLHEDTLSAMLAEQPPRELLEILDKSVGVYVFSRNAEGESVVAMVMEQPEKGSAYWYSMNRQ